MSKAILGMSPITETIYLGRVNKKGTEWASDKRDVTNNFVDVLHQYIAEHEVRTIKHANGEEHLFFHIIKDNESIDRTIRYLEKMKEQIV